MMKGHAGEGGQFKNNNQPESLAATGGVDVAIAVPIGRLGGGGSLKTPTNQRAWRQREGRRGNRGADREVEEGATVTMTTERTEKKRVDTECDETWRG